MTKILITGGTGFLGSYLLRYLVEQGEKVRAIRRSTSSMDLVKSIENQVEWIEADILDVVSLEEAMEGIEQVYHCAAVISFNPKEAKWMKKVNAEGTTNVVNMALRTGVKRFLHVSSIAAIGRNKHSQIVTEETKWERSPLNSNYAVSKMMAEQEAWRGAAEGLEVVAVNPSVIMGSGRWEDGTNGFFNQIWKGLKFYPTGTTGFVDVRDVARAMILLMNSEIVDERYILNGENIDYPTFLTWIAESLNKPKPSIKVNIFLREFAWRSAYLISKITGKKPFLTKETAHSASNTFFYKNDKFQTTFPNFQFTPIQQTIEETAKQYQKSKATETKFAVLGITNS
jgi:nucleoside-diphosphate-sugar epimerase